MLLGPNPSAETRFLNYFSISNYSSVAKEEIETDGNTATDIVAGSDVSPL